MFTSLIFSISVALAQSTELEFLKEDLSDLHQHIVQQSQSVEDWVISLNQTSYDLLCLGETHSDDFRKVYAQVLKNLQIQKLALEATPTELQKIKTAWLETGSASLLNANVADILSVINAKNPAVDIVGVEATAEQDKAEVLMRMQTGKGFYSRDGFIAQNIMTFLSPGTKMAALYGRLHCARNNMGLGSVPFARFLLDRKKVLSVVALPRRGRTLHPLVSFLDMGVEGTKPIRVVDLSKLEPRKYNYHWDVRSLAENFDYALVF